MTLAIGDFTGGQVEGSGVFDELMRTVKSHIEDEYAKSRIKGSDYATVYLGSIQSAMQTATQVLFSLETTNQQVLLLQEQVKQAAKQTSLLDKQVELAESQLLINAEQLLLTKQQVIQSTEQTKLITEQTKQVTSAILTDATNRSLIEANKDKISADTLLVNEQITNAKVQKDILDKQVLKHVEEIALLKQKTETELAQTKDEINGVKTKGMLGKQMLLFERQSEGFLRDAEQKLAKQMLDTIVVRQTTDGILNWTKSGLQESEVLKVLDKAKEGIDVAKAPPPSPDP